MADSESETATRKEISEASFLRLLKERIFVDYFNVFLSLPVFSQRVVYKFSTKEFEFDPQMKFVSPNVRLDRNRTLSWLYQTRLPPFLRTDIYLEYKLCTQLLQQPSKRSSTDNLRRLFNGCAFYSDQINDALGHVTGMRQFRKYLGDGPGARLLKLWMDVERFFQLDPNDQLSRWMTFREIQVTFYDFDRRPNAVGDWTRDDSSCVILDGQGFVESSSLSPVNNPTMSKKAVDQFLVETYSVSDEEVRSGQHPSSQIPSVNLRAMQTVLLQILRNYWLPKWLLHRQVMEQQCEADGSETRRDKEQENQAEEVILTANVAEEMKNSLNDILTNVPAMRRPIGCVIDDRFLSSRETNEVLTLRDDGVVTLTPLDPTVSRKVKMTDTVRQAIENYLPDSQVDSGTPGISESMSTASTAISREASEAGVSDLGPSERPSSDPSQHSLQLAPRSRAVRKFMKLSGIRKLKDDQDRDTKLTRTIDELRQKTTTCHELSNLTISQRLSIASIASKSRAHSAVPCFPPSPLTLTIEPDIPTQTGYRFHQRAYLRGIVTDRLAGGPFELFLTERGCDEARAILDFWTDSQVYLACRRGSETSVQSYVRCRRAKSLIMRYLTGQADKRVCVLPPTLRYSLQRHLAIGKGEELMKRAQDVSIEFLRPMWDSFLENDSIRFENSAVSMRRESRGARQRGPLRQFLSGGDMYFQEQARSPRPFDEPRMDPEEEEKGLREKARIYAAQRRTELALQFVIDMSSFCVDGLLTDLYPETEIKKRPDVDYGSLAVKKFTITHRPDLASDLRRRRLIDQKNWDKKMKEKKEEGERAEEEKEREKKKDAEEEGGGGGEDDDALSVKSSYRRFMNEEGKVIERPERPKTCEAIFEDPVHLEFFRRFLVVKKSELPVLFYLDVEKMKKTQNPVKQNEIMIEILRKYFKTIEDVKLLQCESKTLEEIHYFPRQNSPEKLSIAQSAVKHCLVETWCEQYMRTYDDEEAEKAAAKQHAIHDRWQKFLKNLVKFRLTLMEEESFQEFENYVVKELSKEQPDSGNPLRIKTVAAEVLMVDNRKVVNDIRFMKDMEHFRILSDQIRRLQKSQRMKQEHLEMIKAESDKIRNTYFPPDKEPLVNVSAEVANDMASEFDLSKLGRGCFHDATIEVYQIAYRWWKKFQSETQTQGAHLWEQFAALTSKSKKKRPRQAKESKEFDPLHRVSSSKRKGRLDSASSIAKELKREPKLMDQFSMKQTLNFDDDRIHVVFSVLNGLRLFIPRLLKSDASGQSKQLIPGVYQLFYTMPSVKSKGRVSDGVYDRLQNERKEAFFKSRDAASFPVFLIDGITYVLVNDKPNVKPKGKPSIISLAVSTGPIKPTN